MKFVVIPDSFKGSVSAVRFCELAEKVICARFPDSTAVSIPVCDGGEGSVECLTKIFHGKTITAKVTDGNFLIANSAYGYSDKQAFIAVSESSGLAKTMIKDPSITTTFGMGEQILQAKHLGKKDIVLCLGGSSTNDGGTGLLCALGCKFFDENDNSFIPTGGTLNKIKRIDMSEMNEIISGLSFTALCDVENPLLGEKGCTYVYAPQKGAKKDDLSFLEDNMRHFSEITTFLGCSPDTPGAGAAGGLGYCIMAFLKGKLISGTEYILNAVSFENKISDADYIITGEGRFDDTSLSGKLVGGIQKAAEKFHKPVIVFCGCNTSSVKNNIYEINDPHLSLAENIRQTEQNLSKTLSEFLRTI